MRQRRCQKEQGLLDTTEVHVGAVSASGSLVAVGHTLELDVLVDGVQVAAMVDTGSQSSIISRSLLHRVGWQLRKHGKAVPKLEPATVGRSTRAECHSSSDVASRGRWNIGAHCLPDSSQDCLIGNRDECSTSSGTFVS